MKKTLGRVVAAMIAVALLAGGFVGVTAPASADPLNDTTGLFRCSESPDPQLREDVYMDPLCPNEGLTYQGYTVTDQQKYEYWGSKAPTTDPLANNEMYCVDNTFSDKREDLEAICSASGAHPNYFNKKFAVEGEDQQKYKVAGTVLYGCDPDGQGLFSCKADPEAGFNEAGCEDALRDYPGFESVMVPAQGGGTCVGVLKSDTDGGVTTYDCSVEDLEITCTADPPGGYDKEACLAELKKFPYFDQKGKISYSDPSCVGYQTEVQVSACPEGNVSVGGKCFPMREPPTPNTCEPDEVYVEIDEGQFACVKPDGDGSEPVQKNPPPPPCWSAEALNNCPVGGALRFVAPRYAMVGVPVTMYAYASWRPDANSPAQPTNGSAVIRVDGEDYSGVEFKDGVAEWRFIPETEGMKEFTASGVLFSGLSGANAYIDTVPARTYVLEYDPAAYAAALKKKAVEVGDTYVITDPNQARSYAEDRYEWSVSEKSDDVCAVYETQKGAVKAKFNGAGKCTVIWLDKESEESGKYTFIAKK